VVEGGNPLPEIGAVAWRQRVLVLVVTALVTAGAFAWALAQPTVYSASSRILLSSLSPKARKALAVTGSAASGLETLTTETQAELIGSSAVASRVSEAIRGRLSTEQLTRAVDARVVSDHLIEITAVDATPELAQAEANAFADAYLT
jgi:capsular polysaccharide biosynthesis protein